MKLLIVQVGNSDKSQELNIKNPHAAVANLRAAIAITLHVESRSFIMSCKGQDLNDETQKLGAGGLALADGDTINITVRRQRESTNNATSDAGVDGAVVTSNSAASTSGAAAASAPVTTTAAKPSGKKSKKTKKKGHKNDQEEDDDDENKPLDEISAARSIRHVAAQASVHLNNKEKIPDSTSEDDEEEEDGEEDEEWLTDDGEEGEEEGEEEEESEFDEEAEQEAQEVSRMFDILSSLPNQAEMRQRFQTDPEGTLRALQGENPELFQLINKHPQAFLEMANDDDFDDSEWIGGEDDEMASADLMRLLMSAGHARDGQSDSDDDDDSDHEEDFLPELEAVARGRGGRGRGRGTARGSGRGGSRAGGSASAPSTGAGGGDATTNNSNNNNTNEDAAPPAATRTSRRSAAAGRRAVGGRAAGTQDVQNNAQLTDEDNEKIMRIVELGFSKEQATRAYLRNGKNPDRAAAWLFENQS